MGLNIVAAATILSPSIPAFYGNIMSCPCVMLSNVMACRAYRHLKLELSMGAAPFTPSMSIHFAAISASSSGDNTAEAVAEQKV